MKYSRFASSYTWELNFLNNLFKEDNLVGNILLSYYDTRKITSVSDNSDKLCLARNLFKIELQEKVIENDEDLRSFVKP